MTQLTRHLIMYYKVVFYKFQLNGGKDIALILVIS